jgi:hypothetical protein
MARISAADIIRVWECTQGADATSGALMLLAAAHPEAAADELLSLSIGQRDARLMEMRQELFGNTARAFAECPQCADRLEYDIPAAQMFETGAGSAEPLSILSREWSVRFRLIDSSDFAVAGAYDSVTAARRMLAERCILEAAKGDAVIKPEDVPEAVMDMISERLGAADPNADLSICLECPACGHGWEVIFEIASFLRSEVSALAKRLMREVDVLARAYGWNEADILAMSWVRRQFYMELAG